MKKMYALLLCMTVCGAALFAQNEAAQDGSGGEPLVTRGDYVLQGTTLVQYQGKTEQDLVIPADLGITEIWDEAFQSNRLRSVAIPEGVRKLGTLAFMDCYNLVSVRIPKTLTEIGAGAFIQCGKLTEIKVDKDNPAYRDEEGVLLSRDLSTLVYYPAGKEAPEYSLPKGVKTIQEGAFQGTEALKSVQIPAGVTSIGEWAFSSCYRLTSITLPASVTAIGDYAFYNCDSLTSVTIPEGVTSIGEEAFSYCISLTSVTIPASVTAIGDYAFYYCSSLTSVTLPAGVTAIGNNAFSGCDSLSSLSLLALKPPALGGSLWYSWGTPPPTVISVPAAALDAYKNAAGWNGYADKIQAAR